MNIADPRLLPRLISLHQVSLRTRLHRSTLTRFMVRGKLQPFALMEAGGCMEQFLFPIGAVEEARRLAEAEHADRLWRGADRE